MEVEGIAELKKQLDDITDNKEMASLLASSLRASMNQVKKQAVENISSFSPGKTELHRTYKGRLVSRGFARRSIRVITKKARDLSSVSSSLGVRKEAFYAVLFFERGTSKLAKQPWLVPAFRANKDAAIRQIGDALKKKLESAARKKGRKP